MIGQVTQIMAKKLEKVLLLLGTIIPLVLVLARKMHRCIKKNKLKR
jgi:hypothetical protein